MDVTTSSVSKDANKIRRQWLIATICILVVYPIGLLATFALFSIWVSFPEGTLARLAISAAPQAFWMAVIWHCAYRRHGTGLLTFCIAMLPIRILALLIITVFHFGVWTVGELIINLALVGWWFAVSLRLRRLNLQLQKVMKAAISKKVA
jgi:hypothetical protein